MGEQFKIIEYSLIILFIVTGSVFLISTSDLVSIFLSIELQSSTSGGQASDNTRQQLTTEEEELLAGSTGVWTK
jgi:NADH:ubiquinone oxidoreductase subunit 2 (subunit N)